MENKIQKITPNLWFDTQAEEAAEFYTAVFKNSRIGRITHFGKEGHEIHRKSAGTVMTVEFQLAGQDFVALNGGPQYTFTPAISFFVNCETGEELDKLWGELSAGGMVLMELDKYPFSEKFGWVMDKYGVSWQLNLGSQVQKITPFLMFVREQHGKAEEAVNFYTSLFKNSRVDSIERFGQGEGEPEGTVKHATFYLNGQQFMAMESSLEHQFTFSEAISLIVNCETQEEVDYYWEKLSAGGDEKAQSCGWLKDKYGVSWQIIPSGLTEMLNDPDTEKTEKVIKALLQMKKIDISALKQAYEG